MYTNVCTRKYTAHCIFYNRIHDAPRLRFPVRRALRLAGGCEFWLCCMKPAKPASKSTMTESTYVCHRWFWDFPWVLVFVKYRNHRSSRLGNLMRHQMIKTQCFHTYWFLCGTSSSPKSFFRPFLLGKITAWGTRFLALHVNLAAIALSMTSLWVSRGR